MTTQCVSDVVTGLVTGQSLGACALDPSLSLIGRSLVHRGGGGDPYPEIPADADNSQQIHTIQTNA